MNKAVFGILVAVLDASSLRFGPMRDHSAAKFDVVMPNIAASNTAPVTFTLGGANGTQTLAIAVGN